MVTSDAARIAGLETFLGALDAGRPADILVLERRMDDPWENVASADPSWVELVMIGGDLAYGRADWIGPLTGAYQLEPVLAWGKPLVLDTRYSVRQPGAMPPKLADLRASLIERYPRVGPIFA
jgi:hypothetical protein